MEEAQEAEEAQVRGKLLGGLLIAFAVALAVVPALFLMTGLVSGDLTPSGFMLCEGPMMLVALIIAGAGVYMIVSGSKEAKTDVDVAKQQKILSMVETRGEVKMSDIALELDLTRDQVTHYIYDIVGKKLFTGYVDWKGGILKSQEVKDMPENNCPKCGGQLELAGKGTVKCPYCGSEIFLS